MGTSCTALAGLLSLTLVGGLGGAVVAQDEAMESPSTAAEPWDLVWFSDSTGFFVASMWAETIEEALGVEVRVHDFAEGSLRAVEVLESLDESTEGYKRLGDTRDLVAEAEIIVVYGNPRGSGATDDLETCVTTSTKPRDPPTRYSAEDFAPYREVVESIYERVFDLVGDRPVMVRAIDFYNPVIADWRLAGVETECTAAWEAYNKTVRDAAAVFNVPLVSMYDTFNGPDHSEDPREKGYIAFDMVHTSPTGQEAMVAALHEAGYEPLYP
jgi:hypothetical protein